MAQIVVGFGSANLAPTVEAAKLAIGGSAYTVNVTTARTVDELECRATDDDLNPIAIKLAGTLITSACLHPAEKMPTRFVHLFAPHFCGSSLSYWHGAVEYKEATFEVLFRGLLEIAGLGYAYVGMEEGPDLEERHMSVATVPLDEPPLMISAFHGPGDSPSAWKIRLGPVPTPIPH